MYVVFSKMFLVNEVMVKSAVSFKMFKKLPEGILYQQVSSSASKD